MKLIKTSPCSHPHYNSFILFLQLVLLALYFFTNANYAAENSAELQNIDETQTGVAQTGVAQTQTETEPLSDNQEIEDQLSAEQQLRLQEALLNKQKYQQQIESLELESVSNSYTAELGQAYMDLGNALFTLEQYDEAAEAFNLALQSERFSNGLYSPQQLPILRQLFATNEAMAEWEAADANIHLLTYIMTKNYLPGSDTRLETIAQLGQWKTRVFEEELISGYSNYAKEASELFKNEIEKLEQSEHYPNKNIDQAILYLGYAETEFNLAESILDSPLSDFQTFQRQTNVETRCYFVRLRNGAYTQVCENIETPNLGYYIDPAAKRNQAVAERMKNMKESIMMAYQMLQFETATPEQQETIITQAQALTASYNEFMDRNNPRNIR